MDIQKHDTFENIKFIELNDIKNIKSKSFYDCKFVDCDFTESDFSNSLFSECIFKTSNLSFAKFNESKFQDVHFDGCKILGVDFTQLSKLILEIGFENSKITKCIFASLELDGTNFINCQIIQTDFYDTILKKSNFSGSDLKDTVFENADLTEANFKDSKNYLINPLKNKIKNAEFTMPEAIVLLESLEVKISY
jgi:fluoroquinolone resistance protein